MQQLLWHEPAKYRRAKYRQHEKANPLESVKFGAFAFAVILALRALAGLHPASDKHPPEWPATAVGALAFALIAAYGMPRIIGLFANSIVIISDKGVNNNTVGRGVTVRFWAWDKIDYCYAWTETLYGAAYPVISFCDAAGIVLATLCLNDKVSLQQIEAALQARNVSLRVET